MLSDADIIAQVFAAFKAEEGARLLLRVWLTRG